MPVNPTNVFLLLSSGHLSGPGNFSNISLYSKQIQQMATVWPDIKTSKGDAFLRIAILSLAGDHSFVSVMSVNDHVL